MNLIDIFRDVFAQVPELLQPLLIAAAGTIPFVEGEGAAAIGILGGIHPATAIVAAILGNFICVAVLVLTSASAREMVVNRQRNRPARSPADEDLDFAMGLALDPPRGSRWTWSRRKTMAASARPPAGKSSSAPSNATAVPGVSLLGPLLLPTHITATMLAATGIGRGPHPALAGRGNHRVDRDRRSRPRRCALRCRVGRSRGQPQLAAAPRHSGGPHDRGTRSHEAVRPEDRRRRCHVHRTPRTGHGLSRPDGAGKSTTMRLILGLDRATSGSVTVLGKPYRQHDLPLAAAGAPTGVHPGRTAHSHLRALAATHRIPTLRVTEVLEMTGLSAVANRKVGEFSLGMGQRLGIAAALLGDPQVLLLDEPVNGLDPDGVLWVRKFVRQLAQEGRAVLLSSHLMSEMARTADHVIVLGRGRVVADAPIGEFVAAGRVAQVTFASPEASRLTSILLSPGASPELRVEPLEDGRFTVSGLTAAEIGRAAARHGVELHELTPVASTLEDAYLELTRDDVEYMAYATA